MGLIELKNIYFSYGEEEPLVFRDFSLNIDDGSCVILKGDNGSGKSTLFRIINGLSFPVQGSYLFDGTEITEKYLHKNSNSKLFHKRIGYLFQNPDVMLFNSRVYDEVAFGPRQMGKSDKDVEEIVNDCMELFGISELKDKAPYHLSGGQKKKVAMAAVMSLNPEVIVLDEPFAGLDKKSQAWFLEFLSELKQAGKTMIIATHSEELIQSLADREVEL